jgi:hypothetical protein
MPPSWNEIYVLSRDKSKDRKTAGTFSGHLVLAGDFQQGIALEIHHAER